MDNNYREYFIKDGRHIGLYDEMYKNCSDPWNIEKLGVRLDMRAALLLLEGRLGKVKSFLDVGAGLGLFSGLAAEAVWRESPDAIGLITDISPEAVRKVAVRLADPRLRFFSLDARTMESEPLLAGNAFDLIILGQVLWGILENLPEILASLARLLSPGGLLLISQHFFAPGRQGYGQAIVSSPEDLSVYLEKAGFTVLNTLETDRAGNHHWAALWRCGR